MVIVLCTGLYEQSATAETTVNTLRLRSFCLSGQYIQGSPSQDEGPDAYHESMNGTYISIGRDANTG